MGRIAKYSKAENGKAATTVDVLEKIADGLDFPIRKLFYAALNSCYAPTD